MSIILDLPSPIDEELTQEAQRKGISEMEHAALLICLASAFKQDESSTPFQKAVREFLSHHSLDAKQIFSAFEELIRICLDVHDAGKYSQSFQQALISGASDEYDFLKHWRNSIVHQSILSSNLPSDSAIQIQGNISRETDTNHKATDQKEQVRNLLAQWQAEDNTPLRPPILIRPGETPTQALFRKWKEEDAHMTEEEQEAEDRLWEDLEQGLKRNGRELRLRRLS